MTNSDGTFNHFEMKGGIYAGWLKDLNELSVRLDHAKSTFKQMSVEEIDGTTVALCVFDCVEEKINRLYEEMKKFRVETFEKMGTCTKSYP